MTRCARCGYPKAEHPVRLEVCYGGSCRRFVHPAPLWLRVLTRFLGALGRQ